MRKICLIFALLIGGAAFGQWTEPMPLRGPINDDPSSKTWPSINATGDTLYYAKVGTGGNENICFSYLIRDSSRDSLWSAPVFMGPQINTPEREISPSIGPGDSLLYFVTYERSGGYGGYDIWYCRRNSEGQWSDPINAGPNVNSPGTEWGVFLSRDGQSLYFSSTRLHNGNGLEILKSTWQGNGWSTAVLLPGDINSYGNEENITLPQDESFLILTKIHWAATRVDLWISNCISSSWTLPVQIAELISSGDEDGSSLSPDGNTIFFASARNDSFPYRSALYFSHRISPTSPRLGELSSSKKTLVYPNPSHGALHLALGDLWKAPSARLTVYDLLGRAIIQNVSINADLSNLSHLISQLPTGNYWLCLISPFAHETLPIILVK